MRSSLKSRGGITIIEFVVAVAIIGLLCAMTLPAIMSSRETARRVHCSSNLKQLGLAIANYESEYGVYPLGSTHKYQILPFIEQTALYLTPLDQSAYDPMSAIAGVNISIYLCPNDAAAPVYPSGLGTTVASTSYAACFGTGIQRDGYNGLFNLGFPTGSLYPGGFVRSADVIDGLSNTASMSELLHGDRTWDRLRTVWQTPISLTAPSELDQFSVMCETIPPDPRQYGWRGFPMMRGIPWYSGVSGIGMYNHILPPNRPNCTNGSNVPHGAYTAASMHAGGVSVLYGDGRVVFLANSVDRNVWREMGSRISQYINN